jgi:hypothetical protein
MSSSESSTIAIWAIILASLSLLVAFGSLWVAYRAHRDTVKFQEYEYAPRFQIESESVSYARPEIPGFKNDNQGTGVSTQEGTPTRWFSYEAVLHNVGTRALDVSAVYLCACKPDEKGCPRSFQIAQKFLIKPGGKWPLKWPLAFDSNHKANSGLFSDLTDVNLFLQIEYAMPDQSISVFRKKIGGFRGEAPGMFMELKAPKQ